MLMQSWNGVLSVIFKMQLMIIATLREYFI